MKASEGLLRYRCSSLATTIFRVGSRKRDRRPHLANLEAREAAHRDVLAQLANLGGNKLADADGLVADKRLLHETNFFVKLAHLAFHDLFHDLGRLAGRSSLSDVDRLLELESFRRKVCLTYKFPTACRHVN